MIPLLLGLFIAAILIARRLLRERRYRAVSAAHALRVGARLLSADAARVATQLATADSDGRAMAAHARAEKLLASAASADDLRMAAASLAEAQGGRATAQSPCFFDPSHGSAATEVGWPVSDPTVTLPACAADARLLAAGQSPDSRMVRREDRSVPWFEAGPAYDAYASAWFGASAAADSVESVRRSATASGKTAGAWDRIRWAPCSIGGLGEGPNGVHRLGQMLSGQHLGNSTYPTAQRRR
jgi:hypothetical protein